MRTVELHLRLRPARERVDHFLFDGKTIDARVVGTFEVTGDKITAWRDYFDTAAAPST